MKQHCALGSGIFKNNCNCCVWHGPEMMQYVCLQHIVRPATKEFPDAAEIKGCVSLPCKSFD